MDIYSNIKRLADEQKITVNFLEDQLGFGNGTLRRWKSHAPSIDKVIKIADYFGVSLDLLVGRVHDPERQKAMFRLNTNGLDDNQIQELKQEMDFAQELTRHKIAEQKNRE